jgi:hypothetical protein
MEIISDYADQRRQAGNLTGQLEISRKNVAGQERNAESDKLPGNRFYDRTSM